MNQNPKDQLDIYIKGYAAYNQDTILFDYGEVLVCNDYRESTDKIRLVSGGSACHIEYVGAGMLTAAIQGKQKESPTPSVILRTLRELSVNHVKGILIIVQASSSDLLNFGLATERADNDDLRVSFLSVADDCKNNQYATVQKRGLSGVILANKVAGALAFSGWSLKNVYQYASQVANNLLSTGINVKQMLINSRECLYCNKCAMSIVEGSKLKKSILKRLSVSDILSDISKSLITEIMNSDKNIFKGGDHVVVLVNNIGALAPNDEFVFLRLCLEKLDNLEIKVAKYYTGHYLHLNYDVDLTLTILKVFDQNLINYLNEPCAATGWHTNFQTEIIPVECKLTPGVLKRKCRLSPPIKGPKLREMHANLVQLCVQFACDALISCEKMLNKMDGETGDGDTGTRLRVMGNVLNKRICDKKLNTSYPFTFFLSLSKLLENSIGGTMGCLYSIMFEAAANTFGDKSEEMEIDGEVWLQALENSCSAVKKYGNVELGDKTMYDVLQACATTLRQTVNTNARFMYSFGYAVSRAEETAQATRRTGCTYPDAGAHAAGIWLRAVYEGIKLRAIED